MGEIPFRVLLHGSYYTVFSRIRQALFGNILGKIHAENPFG